MPGGLFKNKFAIATLLFSASLHAQWMAGYYTAQNGVEPVSSIPWSKYTEVIHFSASTDGNGNVILHWLSQSEIEQIVAAGHQAGKKVVVCIQDNGSDPDAFSFSTAPGTINTFVSNIVSFMNNNGYDGVDLDWEQNINGAQYVQLLQLLRTALGAGKILSAAMSNTSVMVSTAAAAYSYVDQFNVMCYDMDPPENGFSWYNDALFQNGNTNVKTCDWRVGGLLSAGVPAGKIGIGLPFYGRRWPGVTQAMVPGSFSPSPVLYNQLVADPLRWQSAYQFYDSGYRSNYLSIPSLNEFDSYSGAQELADAAAWIKSKQFGGTMTFSLHYEFLAGQSGDAQYPLSTALAAALATSASSSGTGGTGSGGATSGSNGNSTGARPATSVSNLGVFRNGFFWVLDSNGNRIFDGAGTGLDIATAFGGLSGDIPITGDWSGTGDTKVGVYRSPSGLFLLDYNGNGTFDGCVIDRCYQFMATQTPGDLPVIGDWTGSGTTKIGIYRPATGEWFLDTDGSGVFGAGDVTAKYGGVVGDIPVTGDWTGSGVTKIGIFRSGFLWILNTSGSGSFSATDAVFALGGVPGDVPVTGDWNGSGATKVGVFRAGFLWVLDTNGDHIFDPAVDQVFPFGGIPGDIPVAGKWRRP